MRPLDLRINPPNFITIPEIQPDETQIKEENTAIQ
jgi:hypothetical protein